MTDVLKQEILRGEPVSEMDAISPGKWPLKGSNLHLLERGRLCPAQVSALYGGTVAYKPPVASISRSEAPSTSLDVTEITSSHIFGEMQVS